MAIDLVHIHQISGPDENIRRPSLFWTMTEPARLMAEWLSVFATSPALLSAPKRQGRPVLVLPGFATSDTSTMMLRHYLNLLGYNANGWNLGSNFDQKTVGEHGERVIERLSEIYERTGQKVSLVGWSLGGIIAREIARHHPNMIRSVVTLGSPFTGNPQANAISKIYEKMTGNEIASPAIRLRFSVGHRPLSVPSSAIFSKSDGIAAWKNCISETNDITENIEVHASHFGLVNNPGVFWAIADRLAQADDAWSPFVAKGAFSAFYP
jgi:pimeloyl-ACP methyl ester carboxylesterase